MEGEKGEWEGGSGVWRRGCMGRVQSKFVTLGQSPSLEDWTVKIVCDSIRSASNTIT